MQIPTQLLHLFLLYPSSIAFKYDIQDFALWRCKARSSDTAATTAAAAHFVAEHLHPKFFEEFSRRQWTAGEKMEVVEQAAGRGAGRKEVVADDAFACIIWSILVCKSREQRRRHRQAKNKDKNKSKNEQIQQLCVVQNGRNDVLHKALSSGTQE